MNVVFVKPERCLGCKRCQIACAVEHSQNKDLYKAVFEDPPPHSRIRAVKGLYLNSSFPNKCRQCKPAPCLTVCPTSAITLDPEQEILLIDEQKCISCAICAIICPFDVISFHLSVSARQVASKCDDCIERRRVSEEPA